MVDYKDLYLIFFIRKALQKDSLVSITIVQVLLNAEKSQEDEELSKTLNLKLEKLKEEERKVVEKVSSKLKVFIEFDIEPF